MGRPEDKEKHIRRRKNHIRKQRFHHEGSKNPVAKDLRTRKFEPRVVKNDVYDRNKLKRITHENEEDNE